VAGVVARLKTALDERISVEDYLAWSTAIAVVMFVPLRGSFQIGYVFVIVNTVILLALDRLNIHRNHMLALLALAGFSFFGAAASGTPLNAPASQIVGISLLSVYFFCALTVMGRSLTLWMEMYMRAAFAIAIVGLVKWAGAHILHLGLGETRLTSIYTEPSFFVYCTLPAVGYCVNLFAKERRYGLETLFFLLSYALANSALGFLGLLLIGIFVYMPRLKGWQLLAGAAAVCIVLAGLYVASGEVRQRAVEMVNAIAKQDLTSAGNTTFAFLSNVYVTSQSFKDHPFTGIGLGGYANAYDKYIQDVTGIDITNLNSNVGRDLQNSMQLNRDDAASMFLRVAAELGIPGIACLIGFLIVCARVRTEPFLTLRNAILPYLIVRMTRLGHYFTVELYFFTGIYLFNYLNYRRASKMGSPFVNTSTYSREMQPGPRPVL